MKNIFKINLIVLSLCIFTTVQGQNDDIEFQSILKGTELTRLDSLLSMRDACSEHDTTYAEILYMIADEYLDMEKYEASLTSYLEAAELYSLYNDSISYADCIFSIALAHFYTHDYNNSIRYFLFALDIYRNYPIAEYYYPTISWLANVNEKVGNYTESYRYAKEYAEKVLNFYGKKSKEYARALNNLSISSGNIGKKIESLHLLEQALEITEQTIGKNTPDYIERALNLAMLYTEMGNYSSSIDLEKKLLLLSEIGANEALLMRCKSFMAVNYFQMGKYEDAIKLEEEVLDFRKQTLDPNDPEYATSLHNLAAMYVYIDIKKAIEYEEKALEIRKRVIGEKNITYWGSLNILSLIYKTSGDYEKAISISQDVVKGVKAYYGKNNEEYPSALSNLIESAFANYDYSIVCNALDEYISSSSNRIFSTFAQLGNKDRKAFWSLYEYDFLSKIPFYAYYTHQSDIIAAAYNTILVGKGLLLNTDIEMTKILKESNDPSIIKKYEWLQQQQILLTEEYGKSFDARDINTDSLERIIKKVEYELIDASKTYGDYTRNIKINWTDVQKHLSEKDVAIEFARIPIENDSIIYIAFVLQKNWKNPILVPLAEERQIVELTKKDCYSTDKLSILIWEPLSSYLNNMQNVYFSPSGELYNISIEYTPHWNENCLMLNKWNMYRLSSTRELAVVKEKDTLLKASIFGGIKYDADADILIADERKYGRNNRSMDFDDSFIADSLNLRSGVAYLPATKIEVEDIDKTLEKKKIHTTLRTDTLATEGAFKDLSGRRMNLLHIATHGFYWTERDVQKIDNLEFLKQSNKQKLSSEDKTLLRAGLLFAGANNALMGNPLPENVEDGILTAKEISQLDLRGLDMVVLSACQTGLGEIKGDGVFGLQRGFKKAGANSILMSLWKVDDEATQLLMTQFYQNLMAGKSKYESLREAQRHVRDFEREIEVKSDSRQSVSAHAKEQARKNERRTKQYRTIRPYQDPKYWAAFILLDGLD